MVLQAYSLGRPFSLARAAGFLLPERPLRRPAFVPLSSGMDLVEIESWWQRVQAPNLAISDLTDIVGVPDIHQDDYIDCIPERARFARARLLGVRMHNKRWISGFELGFRSPEPLAWPEAKERLGNPERVVSQPPKWGAPLSFLFRVQRGSRTSSFTVTVAWFDADLSKVDGNVAHVSAVAFARLPGPTDLLDHHQGL